MASGMTASDLPGDTMPRDVASPARATPPRHAEDDDDGGDGTASPRPPPVTTGFLPDEFLPEDYPEVDPGYLGHDPRRPPPLPRNVPAEAWIPAEISRVSSGASIAEANSVEGEGGRMYHGYREGKYYLPNDAAEQERLDLQHQAVTIMMKGDLFWAPVQSPRFVLDVATGTGIWAIEFACQNPGSWVIGTDLSKIQPSDAAPNVEFVREDAEEQWTFQCKFDFVHLRAVFTCFDSPKGVLEQVFEHLNPGGWVELNDGTFRFASEDGSIEGTALKRLGALMIDGAAALGRDIEVTYRYKEWLEEIGFVDVAERKMPWALSGWPRNRRLKLAGLYAQRDFFDGLRGITQKMLGAAGLSSGEIDELTAQARLDLLNPAIHAYMPVWIIYGRKPHEGEMSNGEQNGSRED